MMGGRATAVGRITPWRWKPHRSTLDLMLKSASTSSSSSFRFLASWSGPAKGLATRRTFNGLVVSSPLRFQASPLGFRSQHFFKTIGSWHLLSSTDAANDERKTSDDESLKAALNYGKDFITSILKDVEEIPGSDGMHVLPNVVQLETYDRYDLVIRKVTQPFWEDCIKVVCTPDMRYRVCAVGTPGIGKTSSTPLLIRILLKEKRTVVYRIASSGYFWEFLWTIEQGYVVRAHRNTTPLTSLSSLMQSSTFYIVDRPWVHMGELLT